MKRILQINKVAKNAVGYTMTHWIFKCLPVLLFILFTTNIHGQTVSVLPKWLDGSKGQLAKDSIVTNTDTAYFSETLRNKLDTPYQVKNIVTFKINEYARVLLPTTFTASVGIRIIYTRPDLLIDSVERTLSINYSDTSAYTSRSSFVFNNAHKVTVKILNVTTDAPQRVLSALMLENRIEARIAYKLSCANDGVKNISLDDRIPVTDSSDEVGVRWDVITGADVYDLEWAYTDSTALLSGQYGNAPYNRELIFKNNATRVTVADYKYSIPLLYDEGGVLFFRVRAVQEKVNGGRVETAWSSLYNDGMGQFSFPGHQRNLNWQSSVQYAEDGKRKAVVSYYDGSLRTRQIVTKDNTTNTTIVGESFYDYQGRPVIQVLPSPTLNTVIKYSRNFNRSINGGEYDKANYDTLLSPSDFLTASASPMSTASGANLYYSPNNPEKNDGFNKYIPDAEGYAFTETSYTQDNTGRINRQSAVGPVHKLGSNHETKYYYGTPGDNDLDALFGTEVGAKSHYFKNIMQDANGQYSVTYVDMYGRTVATALSGVPDSVNLAGLSYNPLISYTDTLSRSNNRIVKDLVMENTQSQLVTIPDTFSFKYQLKAPVLQSKNCTTGATICYNGLYDLQITITDDALNQRLGGKAFDTILHNYTPGTIPTGCGVPDFNVGFKLYLPAGNYQITKRLSVNRGALDYYRDSVYVKNQMCTTLEQFIQQQRDIINTDSIANGCVPDCKACRDSIGTWDTFRSKFMSKAGIAPADSSSYRGEAYTAYTSSLEACDVLCDAGSEVGSIRNAMLLDMTGPYGQYATLDTVNIYSIFYHRDETELPPYRRDSVIYYDEFGKRDTVYDDINDTYVIPQKLSPEQFVAKFKNSWAESLLKFHPEYYKLLELQKFNDSYLWDKLFESTDTYAGAKEKGYMNPTGNSSYIFPSVSANKDPLAATQKDALEKTINNFNGGSGNSLLSMWSMATVNMKCSGTSTTCYQQYNTPAKAFNEAVMCKGDLDMAWRAFRQMYLTTKHNIINDRVNNVIYPGYPKVTSAQISATGSQPHFYITSDALAENGGGFLGNNADTTVLKDSINARLQRSYDENCRSYVQAWIKQLAPCNYSKTVLDSIIIPKLLAICKEGADVDHPYGASSVRPASTSSDRSFIDVLKKYNAGAGINDPFKCNEYLITIPAPYDKQPAYTNKPTYTLPTDCECNQLRILNTEYQALKKPSDITLATYLNRTRGTSLSEVQVQQLLSACNMPSGGSCTYFEDALVIPTIMQCNIAPPCATCEVVNNSYSNFQRLYPSVEPSRVDSDSSQLAKNELFVNYMNNQLGMNKQMWEYLDFIDTCKLYPNPDSVVCPNGEKLVHSYTSGLMDTIQDVIRTPDNGFLLAGSTMIAPNNNNAYLIRTDSKGDVLWSKHFGNAGNDNFVKVKNTTDGGFIAIGTIATYPQSIQRGAMIVKLTANGDVSWSRRVGFNTENGETGADIIQTSDGSYAYVVKFNLVDTWADFLVGSMKPDGRSNWLRQSGTNSGGEEGYALLEDKDSLVISGCSSVSGSFTGWLFKMSKSTGESAGKPRNYYIGGIPRTYGNFSAYLYKAKDGYMANYSTGDATGVKQSILTLDENGKVRYARQFSRPLNKNVNQWMPFAISGSGTVVAAQNTVTSGFYMPVWEGVSGDNVIQWSQAVKLDSSAFIRTIIENSDGGFVGAGIYGRSGFMMFTAATGLKGCVGEVINDTYDSVAVISSYINFINKLTTDSLGIKPLVITGQNVYPVHRILNCIDVDSCFRMSRGPLLCGNAKPVFEPTDPNTINNCSDNEFFAVSKGTELFNSYRDSIKAGFGRAYIDSSINAGLKELFTVSYTTSEYHYTLFYYDRAGNLIKTVPPAGVKVDRSATWLNSVKAARRAGTEKLPSHTMVSHYRYNTLGQVTSKQSPDITQPELYAYDRIGREVAARVIHPTNTRFTKYDNLGRVIMTAITSAPLTNVNSRNPYALTSYYEVANANASQIIINTYDEPLPPIDGAILTPHNLRNRISWVATYPSFGWISSGGYSIATFYSYDAHGNVDTLVHDYKSGALAAAGNLNRWKKMVYSYDLISNKVKHFAYQPGNTDAYYHRYMYDAENRLVNVQTSRDSINWDNDAYYQYYRDSRLARSVIGEQQVQGIDYAYTIQGRLKGVNSTADTSLFDIGQDGTSASLVARDAYGFALHYYGQKDYKSISGIMPFADASVTGSTFKPLFNGNIAAISQNLSLVGTPLLYNYSYDVLNRLVGSQLSSGLDKTTNVWLPVVLPDFKEDISYDPNGNIRGYYRNGNKTFAGKALRMDSMVYNYTALTNRLSYISDTVNASNYEDDIDNQSINNYTYNTFGQLVTDGDAGVSAITWNGYGKVRQFTSSATGLNVYTYDGNNTRISKTVGGIETWYVRDVNGNVVSVYTKGDNNINGGLLTQIEAHLYGTSRLGTHSLNSNVQNQKQQELLPLQGLGTAVTIDFIRGRKFFELTNHLGSVMATVSDRKLAVSLDKTSIDYYLPDIVSAQEYYAFGMVLPGRSFSSNRYRYGFGGKEIDNGSKQLDFGDRLYNSALSRWLSIDPLADKYPAESPYNFGLNNPLYYVDPTGNEIEPAEVKNKGKWTNSLLGVYIHAAAKVYFDKKPNWKGEITFSPPGWSVGRADLVYTDDNGNMSIWEIKPISYNNRKNGKHEKALAQVAGYQARAEAQAALDAATNGTSPVNVSVGTSGGGPLPFEKTINLDVSVGDYIYNVKFFIPEAEAERKKGLIYYKIESKKVKVPKYEFDPNFRRPPYAGYPGQGIGELISKGIESLTGWEITVPDPIPSRLPLPEGAPSPAPLLKGTVK